MKRFLSLFLILILLLSFTGCGNDTETSVPNGYIYDLITVYKAGEISYDDLLSIACHSGNRDNNDIDESFVPTEKGELSKEMSLKIRQDVALRFRTIEAYSVPDAKADDVILDYLGCYNGYYAFRNNRLGLPPEDYNYPLEAFMVEDVLFYSKLIHMYTEKELVYEK